MNRILCAAAASVLVLAWASATPADQGGDHPPYTGTLGDVDPTNGTVQVVCSDGTWIGYTGQQTTSITLDGKAVALADLVGKKGYATTADGPKRRRKDFDAITIAVRTPGRHP